MVAKITLEYATMACMAKWRRKQLQNSPPSTRPISQPRFELLLELTSKQFAGCANLSAHLKNDYKGSQDTLNIS